MSRNNSNSDGSHNLRAQAKAAWARWQLAALTGLVTVMPSVALAQSDRSNDVRSKLGQVAQGAGVSTVVTLPILIGRIISVILSVLGVVVLLYVVYAGYLWTTAQGDGKKVDEAKAIMKNAVIGLIVIFASYAIASFVISRLGAVTSTT